MIQKKLVLLRDRIMQIRIFRHTSCTLCAIFLLLSRAATAETAVPDSIQPVQADTVVHRPDTASAALSSDANIPKPASQPYQSGKATYYHDRFHGRRMSNGKAHNKYAYTCAHRTLPLGTKLLVVNQRNQRSVVVEVTDRGPFRRDLIIDLSKAAARQLDMLRMGTILVDIYIMDNK